MENSVDIPQIILIGGTSHTGKSTLARALASKLKGKYLATDKLARHPGRPWKNEKSLTIKPHVLEHYRSLSAPELISDVMIHYHHNVLPQVRNLVENHNYNNYLIIEGSALYPSLVKDIISNEKVRGVWLVGSYSLLKNRIFANSNFYNASKEERYLIYKFLQRTWLYNRAMLNDLTSLGLEWIQVNCNITTEKLIDRTLWELKKQQ